MSRRRARFLHGVRFRLVALVAVPLIPIVGIVAWQASQVRQRAHDDSTSDTLRLARLAAENMTSRIAETKAVMRLAVQLEPAQLSDPARCRDALDDRTQTMRSVTNAFVVGASGEVACSVNPVPPGTSLGDRAFVVEALTTGEPAAGIEPAGDLMDAPTLVVGQPFGSDVLLVAIDLAADLGGIVDRFALPENSTVTLMDANGIIVGRWPETPSVVGRLTRLDAITAQIQAGGIEGTSEVPGSDGVKRIYSFVDVAESSYSIYAVVGVPSSWGLGPANRELRTNLIALGVVALLSVLIALSLGDRALQRHLRAIGGVARRIGGGDLSARVGSRRAATELAELASSVDEMAAGIAGRDAALRTASAERARLVDELIDVQEEERRRIAADIHDDTIQTIVACGMSAQLLRGRLHDPAALAQADQLAERLALATARLRQLTFDLDPAANGMDLAEELDRYLVGALDGRPLTVLVSADVTEELQGPVRQVVFRNVREAALNAATHGAARRVTVVVDESNGGLRVDVTDDGAGFEPDPRGWPGHQGVRTMRHRAEALGGWFELHSVRGTGTRVSFWLPLAVQDQLQPGPLPAPMRPTVEMIGV